MDLKNKESIEESPTSLLPMDYLVEFHCLTLKRHQRWSEQTSSFFVPADMRRCHLGLAGAP